MKIATRSAAIKSLVAAGITEAFAKVFVKETYDFDEDNKVTDDMTDFKEGKVIKIEVEEAELKSKADNFIASFIDVDGQNITVYGEPKYDINGNILHPELDHIKPVEENKAGADEQE